MNDRRSWLSLLLFLVLAILTSHPLSTSAFEVLPGNGDGLYFSWATAWIGHQLGRAPAELFHANIFFPDEGALLYGEPILGIGLLAWPLWAITGDAAATYNYAFVLTLTLSALFMFLLTRELTGHVGASVLAGEIFAFTTANYDSAARLQIVSGQWTPLLLFFLVRLWRRKRLRDGIGMGVAATMQGLSCSYYTLYLLTLLILTVPVLLWILPTPRWRAVPWRGLFAGVAISAALLAPVYAAQVGQLSTVSSARRLRVGALPGTSYWNVLPTNWLYGGRFGALGPPYDDRYFFGFATLAFAALGLALWMRAKAEAGERSDGRRFLTYFFVFGVLAFLLGCGRYVPLWGVGHVPGPYAWLHAWVPGYDQTRVPSRFVMFLRIVVALFAAVGVVTLAARLVRRPALARALWIGALFLLPLEHVSLPLDFWRLPRGRRLPDVYRFLPTLPERASILEYPQNPSRGRRSEALWLTLSTLHWRPILNGFGANYPLIHYYVQDQLVATFPNVDSIRMLRALGVRYVVFHPDYGIYPEMKLAADRFVRKSPRYRHSLELVREFDDRGRFVDTIGALGGESVYRVLPETAPKVRVETDDWPRLPKQGWSCVSSVGQVPSDLTGCEAVIDGKVGTVFRTVRSQRTGDSIRIDFPRPLHVRGASVLVGRHAHEYPRRLQILGRVGGDWYTLGDWNTIDSVEFVRDVLETPQRASLDYAFDPVEVDALRFRIGPGPGHILHEWIQSEIDVFGAE